MKYPAPAFKCLPPGYTTAFELAIRFHRWWQRELKQGREPSPQDIARVWGCTRSTAYRWRDGYKAALERIGEAA